MRLFTAIGDLLDALAKDGTDDGDRRELRTPGPRTLMRLPDGIRFHVEAEVGELTIAANAAIRRQQLFEITNPENGKVRFVNPRHIIYLEALPH